MIKPDQPIGVFSQFEGLDPAVIKAQRMAELEQIAKYRAGRLEQYQEWSAMTPEQREERAKKMADEAHDARGIVAQNAEDFAKAFDANDHTPLKLGKEWKPKLSFWDKVKMRF